MCEEVHTRLPVWIQDYSASGTGYHLLGMVDWNQMVSPSLWNYSGVLYTYISKHTFEAHTLVNILLKHIHL